MNKVAIIIVSLILVLVVVLGGCAVTGEPEPSQEPERTPDPAPTLIDGTPNLCLSPVEGNVGTEITVKGTGFIAGSEVTIFYAMKRNTPVLNVKTGASASKKPSHPDDRKMATVVVDSRQTFLVSFIAPSKGGEHTVTATDGTNTLTATFTMDDFPPPSPWTRLPEKGTRAVSRAHFEWGDVRDPSGITYSIQVCTNQNFRDEDLVLEKRGLNVSEYTLREGERLESTGKGNPYYWRVKAVDGASNESEWSTPGSFYVD